MTEFEKRLFGLLLTTDKGSGGDEKSWDEMTWDDVVAATKNDQYKRFRIGDVKELDLGSQGIVHMQIAGIDEDDLADGSGKSPLTFISKELLATKHRMNPAEASKVGTGAIGGWEKCEMRTYLSSTIYSLIPESIIYDIKLVKKTSRILNSQRQEVNNIITEDKLWIPSVCEIYGPDAGAETEGCYYQELFSDDNTRIKSVVGEESADFWWLRSAQLRPSAYNRFNNVYIDGEYYNNNCINTYGVAIGFCL